jgi:hypothetical protein
MFFAFSVVVSGRDRLLRREHLEEDVSIHVVESGDVHAERVRHAAHVQSERLEQGQKINLLTCK